MFWKKGSWVAAGVLVAGLLAGCGSAEYTASLEAESGQPLVLTVQEGGVPVSGLEIQGTLAMKKMDHGTVDVVFEEKSEGIYEAAADLPMGGEWTAELVVEKEGASEEVYVEFETTGSY